jgi:hypothetical protein
MWQRYSAQRLSSGWFCKLPSSAKGVATFYTAGRRETLDVIETFALGSLIIKSNAPAMRAFRVWLTGALLPVAFRQRECHFRIRGDGASQFRTGQIGQFDLTLARTEFCM